MRRCRIEYNQDENNWKRVSRVLCDRRISLGVKGGNIKDGCKNSHDIRCRDMGCEDIVCGENEDVKIESPSWTELGMKELEGQ